MLKIENMIRIKNHNQTELFAPWDFLSPKRKKMLSESWAGLFQEEILTQLPVKELASYFNSDFGRPTKELHTVLGTLIIQQMFDLTDEETVSQLAFNMQWHYALNLTEESDDAKYICPKTLWNMRKIVIENALDELLFSNITKHLVNIFNVNTDKQRIDSVHIKSNMRKLGRITIFTSAINKFLVNIRRSHKDLFDTIDQNIIDTYLSEKALSCFSMVKPSDSHKTLTSVSNDLYDLVELFKSQPDITNMHSYKLLERVLNEQCNIEESKEGNKIEIKKPAEIPSSSLQNPSDPDATYSGHKGQGYQAQVIETYTETDKTDEQEKKLNLITHVELEEASSSDANALIPAIESTKEKNIAPKEVIADTLYGSDDNVQAAKTHGVELTAPVMGRDSKKNIELSDFNIAEDGHILSCPQGNQPESSKKKKDRYTHCFSTETCLNCPLIDECPIKPGKKKYYLRYNQKDVRISRRKTFEKTEEFKEKYRWRSGVEATMSEYDKLTGVKHLRVRGKASVRFSVVLKAIGVNIHRASAYRKWKIDEILAQISACIRFKSIKLYFQRNFVKFCILFKLFFFRIRQNCQKLTHVHF